MGNTTKSYPSLLDINRRITELGHNLEVSFVAGFTVGDPQNVVLIVTIKPTNPGGLGGRDVRLTLNWYVDGHLIEPRQVFAPVMIDVVTGEHVERTVYHSTRDFRDGQVVRLDFSKTIDWLAEPEQAIA